MHISFFPSAFTFESAMTSNDVDALPRHNSAARTPAYRAKAPYLRKGPDDEHEAQHNPQDPRPPEKQNRVGQIGHHG